MSSTFSNFKANTIQLLHSMYVGADGNCGLVDMGKQLGLHLFAPRRKLNILLIGNHSSGKSSFINWYVGEKIQKTGVAIETQGFTVVTNGKSRETLTGEATLHLYPYLKPLQSINGVMRYLNAELTKSSANRSSLISFIDTPGLADGAFHYPYDIKQAITWLGDKSDLIFVFFDPIGQALCKRTLDLVEKLTSLYPERMRYFLSKADEAGDETDRRKVMMQIVQELCKRPGSNQNGFEMLSIYLPDRANLKVQEKMCVNQIEDVHRLIDKTIALNIQNTFNTMEKDLKQMEELVENKLKKCKSNMFNNIIGTCYLIFFFLMAPAVPSFLYFFFRNFLDDPKVTKNTPVEILEKMHEYRGISFVTCIAANFITIVSFFINFQQNTSLSEIRQLWRIKQQLKEYRQKRQQLFAEYLDQMITDIDK